MGGIVKGYPSEGAADGTGESKPSTVEPVRLEQNALSVLAHQFVYQVATDAAEAGSTTKSVVATAHVARRGDVVGFTSGALDGLEVKVLRVEEDVIHLAEELPEAPEATDTFEILRHKYPRVDSDGAIIIASSS